MPQGGRAMKRILALGLAGLVAMAVLWTVWPVQKSSITLTGRLLAVGYAPGCADARARDVGLLGYVADARERLLNLIRGAPAVRSDCRVTAIRWMPNVIVNAGENWLVQLWIEGIRGHRTVAGGGTTYPGPLSDFRFHACGSEDTATAEAHTGLVSECTTQTDANNLRQFGTLIAGASPNILRSQTTIAFDATDVITEWGVFHAAAVNTGHMWSRVVVSPGIGVNSGDSVTFTYDLTIE